MLYQFQGLSDGAYPEYGPLVWDQQGNIYGTTLYGGTSNQGTVYELTRSGNTWTKSTLYSFSGGPDGDEPVSGVTFDKNGNLLGVASTQGIPPQGYGVIYELTYVPGIGWKETVIYTFQDGDDGRNPSGPLIADSSGNFYGATAGGMLGNGGTVFELTPSGDTYTFKVLYILPSGGPSANLTFDAMGNLYGTTEAGGQYNQGSVFKLTNTQNGWVYTSLHDFTGFSDGALPQGSVTIDTDGTLYGTTNHGGEYGDGVVWMIKP